MGTISGNIDRVEACRAGETARYILASKLWLASDVRRAGSRWVDTRWLAWVCCRYLFVHRCDDIEFSGSLIARTRSSPQACRSISQVMKRRWIPNHSNTRMESHHHISATIRADTARDEQSLSSSYERTQRRNFHPE